MLFGHLAQPVFGQVHGLEHVIKADVLQPLKGRCKGAVELVDVALVFDHRHAGEIVKRLNVIGGQPRLHAFEKGQKLAQRDRNTVAAQLIEERQKHQRLSARSKRTVAIMPTIRKAKP